MATSSSRYTEALANQYRAALSAHQKGTQGSVDYSALTGNSPVAAAPQVSGPHEKLTGIRKFLDVLSQPLYATVQTGKESAADVVKGVNTNNVGDVAKGILGVPFRFLGNFGTGNDKKAWSDVLRGDVEFINDFNKKAGINKTVTKETGPLAFHGNEEGGLQDPSDRASKFAFGLLADIVGDPTTYIGPGAIKGALKAPIQIAEKTAVGRTAIEAAKSTKIGQDLANISQKSKGLQVIEDVQEGVEAGTAKADAELIKVGASKAEAAGEVLPELSVPAPPARFADDLINPPEIATPEIPVAESPLSPTAIPDEIPAPDVKPARMLLDQVSGNVVSRTSNLARQLIRDPMYSPEVIQRLKEKPLVRDVELTPLQKAEADAREILASRETPAPVETSAPVEIAPEANSNAAFVEYLKQVSSISGNGGERARRLIQYQTKMQRGGKLSPTEETARANLLKEMRTNFSKTAAGRRAVRPSKGLEGQAATGGQAAPISGSTGQAGTTAATSALRVARARTASARRLSGKALESWIAKSEASGISISHMAELLSAKNTKEYNTVIGKMARSKGEGTPRHLEFQLSSYENGNVINVPESMPAAKAEEVLNSPVSQILESVEPVSSMVARATPPNPEALAQIASGANLNETSRQAIQEAARKQGWLGKDEEFPFESGRGTQRTSKDLGEGFGRNVAYNANMQQEVFRQILNSHAEEIAAIREARKTQSLSRSTARGAESGNKVNTKWKIRANQDIYNLVIQDLRDVDDFMFANGVYGVASSGKKGVPLYISQVLDSLMQSTAGRNMVLGRVIDLWGFEVKPIKPGINNLTGQTAKIRDRAGTVDLDSLIKYAARVAELSEKPDAAGIARFQENVAGKSKELMDILRGKNVGPQGETFKEITTGASRTPVTGDEAAQVAKEVASSFSDPVTLTRLFEHVNTNSAMAIVDFGRKVQSVTQETVSKVLRTLDDQTGAVNNGDRVESLLHPERVAKTLTPSDNIAEAADDLARAQISEIVPEIDVKNAQAAETAFRHGDELPTKTHENNSHKAGQENYEANAQASLLETPPVAMLDQEQIIDIAMQTGIGRTLDFLGRKFVAGYGNATVHEAITAMGSVGGVLSRVYTKELTSADKFAREIAKSRGLTGVDAHRQIAKEAWDIIRTGNYDEVGPEMAELTGSLRNLVDYLFATPRGEGKADSLLSTFIKFDVEHINMKMEQSRFGLPEDARLQKTVQEKGKKPRPATVKELSDQWKSWPVNDPIDFLHRMERVNTELATEAAISREFYRLAKSRGLASTKTRPGFVGVSRQSLGPDSIVRYLPASDKGVTYIHKDLLPEIKRMDDLLEKVNSNNAELRHWLRNNLDPILAMWKSGMTIWRPGHHFRNVVGDMGMAFLVSGVKNPKYYARAVKMITSKQNALGRNLRGDYGTWDALAAMQGLHRAAEGGAFNKELGEEILSMGGDAPLGIAARTKIGNQPYDVQSTDLFRELMNRGVLPDFRRQEDIIDMTGETQSINTRIASRLNYQGSQAQQTFRSAHNKLANFTEARDDFIRLSHAMHLIENGVDGKKAWKTAEEMYDQVAARIRKTHPDGTDLTPFEKNVMRRVFPFYSWTRKAIPLVFENTLTHPGRFLAYPKAMYNFGEANGVDLESLSEPFPSDQIFPSFISDQLTGIGWESPDGHYWSFDSGVPQADIGNQFVGNGTPKDIIGGIAGMLNPAVKVPVELMTGTQLQGQIPITDSSDYIDQQIPGANTISSIFGLSPSSVVENAAGGTLGIDPTRQVERGNRGGISENPEYALNYLFGQRLLDTSKPNYITLGRIQQIEKMNKLKEQNASN